MARGPLLGRMSAEDRGWNGLADYAASTFSIPTNGDSSSSSNGTRSCRRNVVPGAAHPKRPPIPVMRYSWMTAKPSNPSWTVSVGDTPGGKSPPKKSDADPRKRSPVHSVTD